MKFLIVYPGSGNEEVKETFSSPQMAVSFIEEKLRHDNVRKEEIQVFSLAAVPFDVEHVPVVKFDHGDEPEMIEEHVYSLNG